MKTPEEETLQQIEAGSKEFHEQACQLSKKLAEFEERLNAMPGKVEVVVGCDETDLVISFERDGKKWRLSYGSEMPQGTPDEDDESGWITDACLDIKINAVMLLPKLLSKLRSTQQDRIKNIKQAILTIDSLKL